jgi:hypothetical protein
MYGQQAVGSQPDAHLEDVAKFLTAAVRIVGHALPHDAQQVANQW